MKGHFTPHTEEAKRKMREAKLGKKLSEEHKRKIGESQTGEKHWLYGKHHKIESLEKMSEAKLGKHLSPGTEFKKGKHPSETTEFRKGDVRIIAENNPNWKGGVTPENEKIRKSIEYRLWRESVFARDNFTCQECENRGGKLHAHHIKSFADFPELRLAIDNGKTLCRECHLKVNKQQN
jgi:hypothetical protein